ncbi:MAG TPA: hypothetical protein VFD82_03650 [Planctomycetota bacterium]|nr:hypothetical protein [Planctomycetota bacterium]
MSWAVKGLAAAALACAALASAAPWFSSRQEAAPTGCPLPASKPPAPAPAPAAEVASVERAKESSSVDHSRELELPDGSFVPALNGAVGATRVAEYWGPLPWSPIAAVERSSAGVDWYRHQDGSYSTTQMVWRKDLGRYEAMTRVAHPGPTPAPVAKR